MRPGESVLRSSDWRRGELVARKLRAAARWPVSIVIMIVAIAMR